METGGRSAQTGAVHCGAFASDAWEGTQVLLPRLEVVDLLGRVGRLPRVRKGKLAGPFVSTDPFLSSPSPKVSTRPPEWFVDLHGKPLP